MERELKAGLDEISKITKSSKKLLKRRFFDFIEKNDYFYEELNGDTHLRLHVNEDVFVDLWPGTGKWTVLGSNEYRSGLVSFAKYMKDHYYTP